MNLDLLAPCPPAKGPVFFRSKAWSHGLNVSPQIAPLTSWLHPLDLLYSFEWHLVSQGPFVGQVPLLDSLIHCLAAHPLPSSFHSILNGFSSYLTGYSSQPVGVSKLWEARIPKMEFIVKSSNSPKARNQEVQQRQVRTLLNNELNIFFLWLSLFPTLDPGHTVSPESKQEYFSCRGKYSWH